MFSRDELEIRVPVILDVLLTSQVAAVGFAIYAINFLCESLESLFYCINDLDPDITSVTYRDPKLNPCK